MKILKNSIALMLALTFCLSAISPVFALSQEVSEDTFSIDDYQQYVFESSGKRQRSRSNEEKIDDIILFVESLNLSEIGYSHIEDACLAELEDYKNDGDIELESYTVLVPKTRAKNYFGTYLKKDYYYEYTSVANMRRETNGDAKKAQNEASWNYWITGVINLGMCFSTWSWSVPYTIITAITGIPGASAVHYNSYNQYVEQFTNTVTRTIYKETTPGNYVAGYQDQTSSLRIKMYFCPVGTAFSSDYIEIGDVFNGSVSAADFTDNEIMSYTNSYVNHGGKVIYKVSNSRIHEIWN